MPLDRRTLLTASAAAAFAPFAARAQTGQAADPRLTERSVGSPNAPVTVEEYFSLTCSHCAAFHRETWPRVKQELVDTGKVRMVFKDFPLDQVALAAHMVARALPPERYEGFISALFASQDRWAYGRGDKLEELYKIAALAGLSRAEFDAALANEALRRAVLENRLEGERQHNVNSTPSFVIGGRTIPGAIPYDRFAQAVAEAAKSS